MFGLGSVAGELRRLAWSLRNRLRCFAGARVCIATIDTAVRSGEPNQRADPNASCIAHQLAPL